MSTTATRRTRILLVDDHLVVRMGIASIISLKPDMVLVGEAATGVEAVSLSQTLNPDVVMMDIMMPKLGGADATARIKRQSPETRILVMTSFPGSNDVRKALDAGAEGAIVKTSTQQEIIAAIRKVAAGESVLSPEVANSLHAQPPLQDSPILSARQIEVLQLASKGFTNNEIGHILGISVNVVKGHMKLIFEHLGVASRAEAATRALSLHLIDG